MYYIFQLGLFISSYPVVSATLNTTEPDAKSGWFSPPNLRGTTDIIWSCLGALFICVWATIHPDVRSANGRWFPHTLQKLKWMTVGLFMPEALAWVAIQDWYDARELYKDIHDIGGSSWTMTHSFYATMGGFVLEVGGGGRILRENDIRFYFIEHSLPLPVISEDQIRDKSKADSLGKAIACIQASWLVIHCIARARQGLPTSTLEVATLGYVFCALVTYCFWWNKPLDVMFPTKVSADGLSQEGIFRLQPPAPRPRKSTKIYMQPIGLLFVFMMLVFGGLHCAAWNFDFPTPVEQVLWRICAAIVTIVGPVKFVVAVLPRGSLWLSVAYILLWIPYGIARMYLLVEPFIGLRSAPAGIYRTVEWVEFLPHW